MKDTPTSKNIQKLTLIILVSLLFITILVPNTYAATNDQYNAKLTFETKDISGWEAPFNVVLDPVNNITTKLPGDITLSYFQYVSDSRVWIKIAPTVDKSNDIVLQLNQPKCFDKSSQDNYISIDCDANSSIGAIRLTLVSINKIVDSTSTTLEPTTSDNVVNVYIISTTGNNLALTKDGEDTYNIKTYGEEKGWTSAGSKDSLQLYVKKLVSNPMALSINTNGEYTEESTTNPNIRKFLLKSNDHYTFTIKYKDQANFGLDVDKSIKYQLNVKGLNVLSGNSSTSQVPLFPAPYDVNIGEAKDLTLPPGAFANSPVATISQSGVSQNGDMTWKITFSEVGMEELTYTLTNGPVLKIPFRVLNIQPTTTTAKALQNPSESGSSSKWALAVIGLLMFIIVAIYLTKRKGTSRRTSNTTTPDLSEMG